MTAGDRIKVKLNERTLDISSIEKAPCKKDVFCTRIDALSYACPKIDNPRETTVIERGVDEDVMYIITSVDGDKYSNPRYVREDAWVGVQTTAGIGKLPRKDPTTGKGGYVKLDVTKYTSNNRIPTRVDVIVDDFVELKANKVLLPYDTTGADGTPQLVGVVFGVESRDKVGLYYSGRVTEISSFATEDDPTTYFTITLETDDVLKASARIDGLAIGDPITYITLFKKLDDGRVVVGEERLLLYYCSGTISADPNDYFTIVAYPVTTAPATDDEE
jgi:hypothetical protein